MQLKSCLGNLFCISIILLTSPFSSLAQSPTRKTLSGQIVETVSKLPANGMLDEKTLLRLSINLPLRNRDALTNLLEQLYDPTSPLYHHYLTAEEFDARFGPTVQDYESVAAFAETNGFTIGTRHANRMLLEVSASVADINRAFSVTLKTFEHPTEHRTFFSPDTEPLVGLDTPILYVGGLDDYARPHPRNLRRALLNQSRSKGRNVGTGPNGNLAGIDYRAAYVPGTTLTGAGQMVGLVEFDGFYSGDITSYESQTGEPSVPLQIVPLDSFNEIPTTGANSGNSEVALDIELAISMAPGLSSVAVYEAGPNGLPNDILQAMSTNTLIKQFSCSWGFGTVTSAQRTAMDGYFQKMAAQGQSFFDASGDSGATTTAVEAPGDDPYITQVGGTALATAGAGNTWLYETVWNAQEGPGVAGSSGGVSTGTGSYAIPSWQQGVSMTANLGSKTKRNYPDVAMVADNVFIVADDGQEETTGGTSCAAPLWAGFAALANQQAAAVSLPTIGFINPAIYHIGTNSGYTACFDDVTIGNNTNTVATEYFAVPGYDLCTGWGSPSGTSLIIALTQPDGFQVTPGRGAVANGPIGGPFSVSSQILILTNAGFPAFNWSLGGVPNWLSVSNMSGTLTSGGASTSVSLALNSAANQLPAGIYTANITFTNLTSGEVQLRQFTLQVGQELVQDGGFESGDFCYWNLSGDSQIYNDNYVDDGYYTGYSSYAGYFFAALGQQSDLSYLSQFLPTRPGQHYVLSFWLQNPGGYTPNQFQVLWNTNSTSSNIIFNQVNSGASDWTQMQFLVEAASTNTTLEFASRDDNDFLLLDSVSVIPVPSPTLQVLAVNSSQIQLRWITYPSLQYQVQYKSDLSQTGWTNLNGVVTATSTTSTLLDSIGSNAQRLYRVELLP